jgi:hypothetical protein
MTKRPWALALAITGAVLLAVALVLGSLALVGRMVWQQAKTVRDPAPPTAADKRLLVTAADVAAAFGGPAVDSAAEEWSVLRQGNGSRWILYLYQPKSDPLFIYSRAALLPNAVQARQMYKMDKLGVNLGSGNDTLVPAPELLPGGGDRSAWYIERGGRRVGNFFLLCNGRILQSVRIRGFTLDKPADVQKLLEPILAEAESRAREQKP